MGLECKSRKSRDILSNRQDAYIFFVAKDRKALCSQQKQDLELTVAQIRIPCCKIQTETEESRENHEAIQV